MNDRDRALEEAAQLVEGQHYLSDGFEVWAAFEKAAAKIRALKSVSPPVTPQSFNDKDEDGYPKDPTVFYRKAGGET